MGIHKPIIIAPIVIDFIADSLLIQHQFRTLSKLDIIKHSLAEGYVYGK
jgi:hypothetical protein